MNAANEFDVLIYSFGEQMLTHLGRENLDELLVRGYAGSDTADVLVRLKENTWENQLAAMEQIEAVRSMFLGELSFGYRFLAEADESPEARERAELEAEAAGYRAVAFA